MDTNNKNKLQETGRWLRVTILTLATLGPIINALAARLRERAQALREAAGQLDLAQQSSNLTQEVAKRSSKASQELAKRRAALTHEVKQRSHQVTEQLAERDGTLWTIIGFGIGLIAASVVAYVFIRRRIQEEAEDNEQIQLSNDTHLNSPAWPATIGQEHPVNQLTSTVQTEAAPAPVEPTVAEPVPTEAERPANTTLIGVASTKLYYPVETPLDQLVGSQEGPVEVVYFTSEDEAKAQGFVAA